MGISQAYALTLALVFGFEYCLKKGWDTYGGRFSRPAFTYLLYRAVQLALLVGAGLILYTAVDVVSWLVFAVLIVLIGCLELPLTVVKAAVAQRWGLGADYVHLLVPAMLIVLSSFVDYQPAFSLDYRLVFLAVFLTEPANYLVRWILGKGEASLLERMTLTLVPKSRLSFAQETAAAGEPGTAALKAGRKIGSLERLLILFLIASGNTAGIGFVITAKSIVRYPRLSEPEFAEYYLCGTLLSVVIAVASCFLALGGI